MTAPAHVHPVVSPQRRSALNRRVRFLVAFTISYNVVEAVVALVAGSVSDSSALVGFGLGSVIEVSSALAVAWQFADPRPQRRERTALRIIALSFFGLAAFVVQDAVTSLLRQQPPQHSTPGIVIAALSLLIMPTVSVLQRRTAEELGSHSAVADSKQTLLCSYMSAVLLLGLVANSALDWWWADPAAALVIAGLAVREGTNAWRGDACCSAEALFERDDACGNECQDGCGS